jgi:hypothetical protein
MLASSLLLHPERVFPEVPFLRHFISRRSGIASESYWEFMRRILPSREVKSTSIIRHLYYYPLLKLLQMLLGVASSALDTLYRFLRPVY